MILKNCSKCKETKDIIEFYIDSRKKDGFRAACKRCAKKHHKYYLSTNGKDIRKKFDSKYYKQDTIIQERTEYRSIESNRIKNIKYQKEYRTNNIEVMRFNRAKYRAKKLNATPKWLTATQLQEIKEIYKTCPKDCHVDHIMPLQGRIVSGLHVPWNLQHLLAIDNLRKGNKVS